VLADALRSCAGAQHCVDGQAGWCAEAVQQQVAGVPEARDESQSEQIEEREHDFRGAVGVVVCSVIGSWVCRIASRVWMASRSATAPAAPGPTDT
jgi:hypothetical protein